MENKEKILWAAIKLSDGLIFTGRNHADCILTAVKVNSFEEKIEQSKQGFVTSTYRFVDRKEAAQIALDCGQIKEPVSVLFSEDITGEWPYLWTHLS